MPPAAAAGSPSAGIPAPTGSSANRPMTSDADLPRTPSGRALAGWVPPNRRAPFNATVRRVEIEAAREALMTLRGEVAALPGDHAVVLRLIDALSRD